MASTQDELLEGTFYVKDIQKERTRKRRKEILVSWEDFDEKDNTWEPVEKRDTKELAGGRRLDLMVAVPYGKAVVLLKTYEKLNGVFFVQFIRQHFNITFAKAGPKAQSKRVFVMDNDPSQTSKKAMEALHDIEAKLHRLPSRSQDLNSPENMFHLVKMNLVKEALERKITNESFEQFTEFSLVSSTEIQKSLTKP